MKENEGRHDEKGETCGGPYKIEWREEVEEISRGKEKSQGVRGAK